MKKAALPRLSRTLPESFLSFGRTSRRTSRAAVALSCEPGTVLFKEGEAADKLYGVIDGEVELSLLFKDKVLKTDIQYEESIRAHMEDLDKPITVDSVSGGDIFGWSALVSPHRFTATATCSEPGRVFTIPAEDLKTLLSKDPETGLIIMERLAETVSRRLNARTEKLVEAWGEAFGLGRI